MTGIFCALLELPELLLAQRAAVAHLMFVYNPISCTKTHHVNNIEEKVVVFF